MQIKLVIKNTKELIQECFFQIQFYENLLLRGGVCLDGGAGGSFLIF